MNKPEEDQNFWSDILAALLNTSGDMKQLLTTILAIAIFFSLILLLRFLFKINWVLSLLLMLVVSGILFYMLFHHSEKIPLSTKIDNSNGMLKCSSGKNDCTADGSIMDCNGFDDKNNSDMYECNFDENRIHSSFAYKKNETPTLPIEKYVYEIDELKVSFDGNKLSATFGLSSPLTGSMVSIKDPNININICGETFKATRNTNATYNVSAKWKEIEVLVRKNCAESFIACLNDKQCSTDQKFNDIRIPFAQKGISLKDNTYVFNGKEKQKDIFIPIHKKNFDIAMDIHIRHPSTCFTLSFGNNTIKIENDRLKLNEKFLDLVGLDDKGPIHFQIQKPGDTIIVNVFQDDSPKGAIQIHKMIDYDKGIRFGYSRVTKVAKEVLHVKLGAIEDIRPN